MNANPTGATPTDETTDPGATPEIPNPNDPGVTPEPPAGAAADKSKSEQPKTAEELQAELDSLKAQLSAVNRESAERRKKLAAIEAEAQKKKDAELSDAEREKKRADDAEARAAQQGEQLRRYSILDAVRAAAGKQGVSLNEAALQDAYAAGAFQSVEIDDNGQPQGVDAHFKELLKSRPYLLQQNVTAPAIGATRGGKNDDVVSDAEYAETARRFGLRVPRPS